MKQQYENREEIETIGNWIEIGRVPRETPTGRHEYRLFRKDVESEDFLICVKCADTSEYGFLEGNLSEVSLLFEKAVSGEVPPYVLTEILEDYSKEKLLSSIKN